MRGFSLLMGIPAEATPRGRLISHRWMPSNTSERTKIFCRTNHFNPDKRGDSHFTPDKRENTSAPALHLHLGTNAIQKGRGWKKKPTAQIGSFHGCLNWLEGQRWFVAYFSNLWTRTETFHSAGRGKKAVKYWMGVDRKCAFKIKWLFLWGNLQSQSLV